MLTQEELKRLLHYDPDTGKFTWRVRRGSAQKGNEAGCINGNGYLHIRVNFKLYNSQRLAWLYQEGYLPEHQVDHKDGDKLNNKWSNLREVTRSCNMQNQKTNSLNLSGFTGVSFDKISGKWVAQIKVGGKSRNLGRYYDILEAALVRYTVEMCSDDWSCNYRSELAKAIKAYWPEFKMNGEQI